MVGNVSAGAVRDPGAETAPERGASGGFGRETGRGDAAAMLERSTPLVRAAYTALDRFLVDGRFRPGEKIGTERSLAEQLGVGRAALRKAIEVLEAEVRVHRWVGRTGGLYASDELVHRQLNTKLGVPEIVRLQGRALETVVREARTVPATPPVSRALEIPVGADTYLIRRVRFVDGQSWSLDTSHVSAAQFPGLLEQDLSTSLFRRFGSGFGLEVDHVDETVEVRPASDDEARELDVPSGSALLEFWRITYAAGDLPIEYARDLFRADRTRVHMQKYGVNWKRGVRNSGEVL